MTATFTNTVLIARAPAEVFAYLAAFENVPKWNYAIVATEQESPGPIGVGTRFRQTRSQPIYSQESFMVTVFDPPHRLSINGRLGPFDAQLTYELTADGDGTQLVNDVELRSRSLIEKLAAGRIRSAVAANLDELRKILERS